MTEPSFEISTSDLPDGGRLLVGLADVGVAGLTAADYLVTQADADEVGYVRTHDLPDITPFSEGKPRHPIRVYHLPGADLTVLLCEVFLPTPVAEPLADALAEWIDARRFETVSVLFGAPFPHSDEEHVLFHVGTDDHRARTVESNGTVPPLAGGFFDGLIAELLTRDLLDELPPTGVFVTPTHVPGPDIEAALRLLDGVERVFGVDVDESALETRSAEMRRYYEELAQRIQDRRDGEYQPDEYPDDRMFL